MYNIGIYGGSFNPLHSGHVSCIIQAANQCRELHIIISNGINRNEVDARIRYRWIYQLTKHIGNVKIHILDDEASTKDTYTEEYWLRDAEKVKKWIGKKIDVVFCGDDYDDNSFWKKCYPESEIKYFARNGVSSTLIRSNPYKYWEFIAQQAQSFFVKKVLIIGSESVGKSTLTINLANYYNTNYLEEVGREISEKSGTDAMMIPEDFTEILLSHKLKEMKLIEDSNKVLIEDTDCLITKFYINFLEDKEKKNNENLADAISEFNNYDLILFLEPDVEFVQDGDRSEIIKNDRLKYSNMIKRIFDDKNIKYNCISGDYQTRFLEAVRLIDAIIN